MLELVDDVSPSNINCNRMEAALNTSVVLLPNNYRDPTKEIATKMKIPEEQLAFTIFN